MLTEAAGLGAVEGPFQTAKTGGIDRILGLNAIDLQIAFYVACDLMLPVIVDNHA